MSRNIINLLMSQLFAWQIILMTYPNCYSSLSINLITVVL